MIRRLTTQAILIAALGAGAAGCEKNGSDASLTPNEMSVEELAGLLRTQESPIVLDANSDETRKKHGMIPGAKPLPGSDYPVNEVLPASKSEKLVFYCGSTLCKAAEGAAKKALTAGYSDVNVMPAGIKGWKKAGKPTQAFDG